SALVEVIVRTGTRCQSVCCLISESTARPPRRGRCRSRRTRSRRGAAAWRPCLRKNASASSPSSTQWMRLRTRPSRRTSMVISASSALSSTRRISMALVAGIGRVRGMASGPRGRGGWEEGALAAGARRQLEPEALDAMDGGGELVEVGGLAHAAVGVQVVGEVEGLVGVGRGEDDDRDQPEAGVLPDLGEDLVAGLAR